MKKIRLGFVGCGRVSKKHFEALEQNTDFIEVVACCDHSIDKATEAAAKFQAKTYNNLEEMLTKEQLDICTIATPNGFHAENALMCARNNVDVLCEKPMAVFYEDGEKIAEAFKQQKRNFFLIHQNRYNNTVEYIKNAIDQGRFGKIYMITSNVFWNRPMQYFITEKWHGTKLLDGGSFMTQASHYVDMINWFAGSKPKHVYAELDTLARKIETEDTGSMIIKWDNGAIGNVNVTILTYPKNLEGSITIIGEKGTAKIGGVALNKIEHLEFETPEFQDKEIMANGYETDSVYGFGHELLYKKLVQFYIEKKNTGLIEIDEALRDLKILNAIIESAKLNKTVVL